MADDQPGLAYALTRLRGILKPPVRILPPPDGVVFERDVAVPMADGTLLRVNVFRPEAEERFPVLLCAHPYGKDRLPARGLFGYRIPFQYRVIRQPAPVAFSAWTSWEAPDPAFWVPRGYVLVNCDLRGFNKSEGIGDPFSDAEARDIADIIAWCAVQPWSTGRVGMNGVSYLAISQWKVAALGPPALKAICPWEGFTDLYRDLAYPGGVREDGFVPFWAKGIARCGRAAFDIRAVQLERPLLDAFWRSRTPDLEAIRVPALICASFSDQGLHSRGSFAAFRRLGSELKWLYTHRGGKWATYYSAEALAVQARFFDTFLKDIDTGFLAEPPVRLEISESGGRVAEVRPASNWPPAEAAFTDWFLTAGGALAEAGESAEAAIPFRTDGPGLRFERRIAEEVDICGPMELTLDLVTDDLDDVNLFAGVRLIRNGRSVGFEGAFGFGMDLVARGCLKASMRALDVERSAPGQPAYRFTGLEPLTPGVPVTLTIELLPSATRFRAGDIFRFELRGTPFFRRHPLLGQFPFGYEPSRPGTVRVLVGGRHQARLTVPVLARRMAD